MTEYFIRTMKPGELKGFYKHITRDFLPEEHAPYGILHRQLQNGVQEGLVFCEGTRELAYAICAANDPGGFVLISLLAVFQDCRGRGIGTEFIKALQQKYESKQGIVVEVERPDLSHTQEDRLVRQQRIRFYEKAGFYLIPGIEYSIWDVPMHLMTLPITASKEEVCADIEKIIYRIYLGLMGEQFIHKMQISAIK